MLHNFYERELTKQEIDFLFSAFEDVWDKEKYYWYPLADTKRQDVISFVYSGFEKNFGFDNLRELLINEGEIHEIRENKCKGFVIKLSEFEADYDGSEGYWFNKTLEWAIYSSHEDSITFGGEKLISALKKKWIGWDKYVW